MNEYSPSRPMIEDRSPPVPTRTEGMDIDFGEIGSVLRRYWIAMAAIVLVALAVGVFITLRSPRLYRATATVQIEQQQTKVLASDEQQPSVTQDADRFLQTQLSLLNSRTLALQVARQLHLASTIRAKPGEPSLKLTPEQREEVAAQQLQDGLSVTLPRDSRVAQITFTSPDPRMAAQVANAFADNFILYNLQRRSGESSYARDFLDRELANSKRRLEASEVAVVDYARQNRLVDSSSGNGGQGTGDQGVRLLTTNSMLDINAALTKAQIARLDAERRWQQSLKTSATALPEAMINPAIQQLLQQRAEATASYEHDRQSYKSDFPAMKEARAQIAALDQQIQRLAETVRTSLHDNYLVAAKQESALVAKLEGLKSEMLAEQGRSIQYNILRREVDTNRLMYDGLLQRFKEVSAAAGITASNISVVDRAEVPDRPFSPRVKMNIASTLAGGVALALLFALVRAKVDDTIRTPDDVAELLGLQVLGTIPTRPEDLSAMETIEGSTTAEAVWSLRTSLSRMLSSADRKSILLTSSRGGEGKSTTAIAISLSFAQSGRRAVLVDADLRKPSIHRILQLSNERGLAPVIAGEMPAETALQTMRNRNLRVMTSGPLMHNPAELLTKPALATVLRGLQERNDIVVVDSTPVLGLADTILVAAEIGLALFVVEANRTRAHQVRAALKRLGDSGVAVGGVILNKYDRNAADYGY